MTSKIKLLRLDEFNLAKHIDLKRDDVCLYWREYTTGKDYKFGDTNNLISNFKILPSEHHRIKHKERAIQQLAEEFIQVIKEPIYQQYTFVPIPGSKIPNHPDYDDRLIKLLNRVAILKNTPIDIRDMIISQNTTAAHTLLDSPRPSINTLVESYQLNTQLLEPLPKKTIIIFDDIITKGSHFKAIQRLLQQQYPAHRIVGLFIARSIIAEL